MLNLLRDNSHPLLTFNKPESSIPDAIIQPGDIILVMHTSSTDYEYLDRNCDRDR